MVKPGRLPTQPLRIIGYFGYAFIRDLCDKQDELLGEFIVSRREAAQSGRSGFEQIVIKTRAKRGESPELVLDVNSTPLLFSITPQRVGFSLVAGDDVALLSDYLDDLLNAIEKVFAPGPRMGFEAQAKRILTLRGKRNYEVMERLLPGLTTAAGVFQHVPSSQQPYSIGRADTVFCISAAEYDYFYRIEAPANDEWSTLWFSFTVRPTHRDVDWGALGETRELLAKVFLGDPLVAALCEGAEVSAREWTGD